MDQVKWWLRGSFPQWVTAIMMALLGYFANRTINELDVVKSRQIVNEQRITILEVDSKALHELMNDMKLTHRDILTELHQIGLSLKPK